MSRAKAVLIVAVAMLLVASASSATTKFNCTNGGKVWRINPGMWPIDITMMVLKSTTDCDILVDDMHGNFVALGVSIESRFETVTFGPLPGVPVRITARKASGPNSKAYIRCSDSLRFVRGGGDGGLVPLGSAEALAARDPEYARVLEALKRYQALKTPAAE